MPDIVRSAQERQLAGTLPNRVSPEAAASRSDLGAGFLLLCQRTTNSHNRHPAFFDVLERMVPFVRTKPAGAVQQDQALVAAPRSNDALDSISRFKTVANCSRGSMSPPFFSHSTGV